MIPKAEPEQTTDVERYLHLAEIENKRLREREKALEHALRVAAKVLAPYAGPGR